MRAQFLCKGRTGLMMLMSMRLVHWSSRQMRRNTVLLLAPLALACVPTHRPGAPTGEADRVGIARAVLAAVLSLDRVAADSEYPIYLLRDSRLVTSAVRQDGRLAPDERSDHPKTSWGTDLELIIRGTKVRPGPPPASITGCPSDTKKSFECRPRLPYTRHVMSQPHIAPTGEAHVAVTTIHHRRGDPWPYGNMRAFLVIRSGAAWKVARVDTTGIT